MTLVDVVIAGGGTGGHLYPAIAVAREILRRVPAATVSFAGTSRGLESRVVPPEGFELDLIAQRGHQGQVDCCPARAARLLMPARLFDAWRITRDAPAGVVIGVGGYSSGPVVLAAAMRAHSDDGPRTERRSRSDESHCSRRWCARRR